MRHATGLFAVLSVVCSFEVADARRLPPPPDPVALGDGQATLAPIQVQSLSLVPIIATGATDKPDPLLVLDEAMAQHVVKIRELGDGSVNALSFVNSADQPVFVMAGEVILGGKQDRIIGRNTVIPAKTTLDVPVFCVEHGRWDGKTKEFTTAKALAHGRLRGRASYAAQQDVWDEVAAKNKVRKTENASGTYRQVAQQQSDGTLAAMEKQIDQALDRVPVDARDHMIGYAVALNGAVATVDVFGSPALFKKLAPKLVRSYLTEAIDVAATKDARPPTPADIKAFIADVDKAQVQPSYDTAAASTAVQRGSHAAKATVEFKKAGPPAPAAAPAKPLYENYQRQ